MASSSIVSDSVEIGGVYRIGIVKLKNGLRRIVFSGMSVGDRETRGICIINEEKTGFHWLYTRDTFLHYTLFVYAGNGDLFYVEPSADGSKKIERITLSPDGNSIEKSVITRIADRWASIKCCTKDGDQIICHTDDGFKRKTYTNGDWIDVRLPEIAFSLSKTYSECIVMADDKKKDSDLYFIETGIRNSISQWEWRNAIIKMDGLTKQVENLAIKHPGIVTIESIVCTPSGWILCLAYRHVDRWGCDGTDSQSTALYAIHPKSKEVHQLAFVPESRRWKTRQMILYNPTPASEMTRITNIVLDRVLSGQAKPVATLVSSFLADQPSVLILNAPAPASSVRDHRHRFNDLFLRVAVPDFFFQVNGEDF